jgi:hypothetical protein
MVCDSERELDELRRWLAHTKPRLLVPFKAHLLVSELQTNEESAASCGITNVQLDLTAAGPIALDGQPYRLSDCGAAMLDKLAETQSPDIWSARLAEALADNASVTSAARRMAEQISAWVRQGWLVILLKEEIER